VGTRKERKCGNKINRVLKKGKNGGKKWERKQRTQEGGRADGANDGWGNQKKSEGKHQLGGRVWGKKGERIGEASHPGPEHWETHDEEDQACEREAEAAAQKQIAMADEVDQGARHESWLGSNMDVKGDNIGARVVEVNFQRKLYGSRENVVELIQQCEKMQIDIIVGNEPGPGTPTNITMFMNTLAEYEYKANYSVRDDRTIGGGTVVITNRKWSKIPTTKKVYEPKEREEI